MVILPKKATWDKLMKPFQAGQMISVKVAPDGTRTISILSLKRIIIVTGGEAVAVLVPMEASP
jgi:hypothetical protein